MGILDDTVPFTCRVILDHMCTRVREGMFKRIWEQAAYM